MATGVSLYREKTVHYSDELVRVETVKTRRLDALAKEYNLPPPDFIKLDVQGAESTSWPARAIFSGTAEG